MLLAALVFTASNGLAWHASVSAIGALAFQGRGATARTTSMAVACESSMPPRRASPTAVTRQPTIHVRVRNDANVAADVLTVALERVGSVLERAGLAVQWAFEQPVTRDGSRVLDLVLVSSPSAPGPISAIDGTLGLSHPAASRAHIYYDAIRDAAAAFLTSKEYLLADVIAHELGHLLLSSPGHSEWGVMRPDILRRGLARWFSDREAAQMTQQVQAGVVGRPPIAPAPSSPVMQLASGWTSAPPSCRAALIAAWRCPASDALSGAGQDSPASRCGR